MQAAASANPIFNFKARLHKLGHFITDIAGTANNIVDNTFWIIYILRNQPDVNSPPTGKDLSPKGK